jgi:hypothetical protein
MDTPATDRAIAWIRTMRMLGTEDGARIADELAAMAPQLRTVAVHGFLREIERFTFGPDQSRIGQQAAERLGGDAWAELQRAVHAVRESVAAEMRAAQPDGQRPPPAGDAPGVTPPG